MFNDVLSENVACIADCEFAPSILFLLYVTSVPSGRTTDDAIVPL